MQLFNPNDFIVEFYVGGRRYEFKPKESKDLDEYVANHALERQRKPLVVHTPMWDKQVEYSDIKYSELPWRKLVSMASARGVFKPGASREAVEKAMEEYDLTERGTI